MTRPSIIWHFLPQNNPLNNITFLIQRYHQLTSKKLKMSISTSHPFHVMAHVLRLFNLHLTFTFNIKGHDMYSPSSDMTRDYTVSQISGQNIKTWAHFVACSHQNVSLGDGWQFWALHLTQPRKEKRLSARVFLWAWATADSSRRSNSPIILILIKTINLLLKNCLCT